MRVEILFKDTGTLKVNRLCTSYFASPTMPTTSTSTWRHSLLAQHAPHAQLYDLDRMAVRI